MRTPAKRFLSKVEISTFKRLRNVKLEDLGQINLIVGDNNVGKTSVLEALVFDSNPLKFLANLNGIYHGKINSITDSGKIDFIAPFYDAFHAESKIQVNAQFVGSKITDKFSVTSKQISNFTEEDDDDDEETESVNKGPHVTNAKNDSTEFTITQTTKVEKGGELRYMPFISPKVLYSDDLLSFYSNAIIPSKAKKDSLIQSMRYFIPELEDIEIATNSVNNTPLLITRVKGIDSALPLSMYGDGSIKFFRILVEIAVSVNTRLMIDEIDSGIHFSRLKSLWRIVIHSAIQNNTQLFITTHNDECLLFLKEVLQEEGLTAMQSKTRCYTLKQLPNGSIKAYKYNFEEFSFAINQQIELRGGKA